MCFITPDIDTEKRKLSRDTEKIVDDDVMVSGSPETTSPDDLLFVLCFAMRFQIAI